MTDLAALGLSVRSDGVVVATDKLDDFKRASDDAARGADTLGGRSEKLGGMLRKLAVVAGGIAGTLAGMFSVRAVLSAAETYETRMLRLQAVINATGGIAGRTTEQLEAQAQALARATLESVDGVMAAQQTLLTFRNVQGDIFDRTIEAAADMSAALGTGLQGSILQLAKALENPTQGLSALTRSGTVFTEQQKEMVAAMVEAGDLAKAQAFILSELEAQYGGASRAASGLSAAKDSLGQSFTNLLISINTATGLSVALAAAYNGLSYLTQLLADNMGDLRGFIIAAGIALAVTYTPAIWGAIAATATWVSGLITLRGALLATGIGAVVVLAGLLINKFLDLVKGAGGFGNAMELLGNVASEVWDRIKLGGSALERSLAANWFAIKASFLNAIADMAEGWGNFAKQVGQVMAMIPGLSVTGTNLMQTGDLGAGIRASANDAFGSMMAAEAAADALGNAASRPLQSIQALRDAMTEAGNEVDAAKVASDEVAAALENAGNAGGGAGKKIKDAMKEAKEETFDLNSSLAQTFTDALTGAKNLQDGIKDLLKSMANLFLNEAFTRVLTGLFPGFSAIPVGGIPGRERGGPVQAGRPYIVGERRPELFVPGQSGRIIPHVPAMSSGGGTSVQIINNTGEPVREQRQTGPDGREVVRVVVGEEIAKGGFDRQMGRFGVSPAKVRR